MDGSIEQILAAIEAHSSRSLDIARASLEAAAAQAALLEEQKKQTEIARRREALERSQHMQVGQLIQEARLILAAHQETLAEFNRRFSEIELLQQQTMEFVKVALESGLKLSEAQQKRVRGAGVGRSRKSLQNELANRYRSLETAREKAAKFGLNVPIEVVNEVAFLEGEIERLEEWLNEPV